jgi:RNA polymerase sigma-70 factor (ECF subfamily)
VEPRQETIPDRAQPLPREELLLVAARDPAALGRFFDRYVDRVFALACRMLGDRTAAEDVSQEVFLKIHRAIDRLDPERDPGPWVTTITCNACREHWRGLPQRMAKKTQALDDVADWHGDHPRAAGTPEQDLERAQREQRVQRALMKLPEELREIVILHDWQGMKHREIADVVGVTHDAVRKRYSRALAALAKLLEEGT